MYIYFFLLFVLSFACLFRSLYIPFEKFVAIFCLIIFAFLGYFRSITVGSDNLVYSMNFDFTRLNPDTWSAYTEFESGFNVLIALFKQFISKDYYTFMGFLYICWIFAFYKLLKIFNVGYIIPIFVALCLGWLTNLPYNIMRQVFALSIYVFILPLLLKGKRIEYVILCVCIGFLFHRSIIVLAIIGFINNKYFDKFWNNKKLLIILVASSYIFVFLKDQITELLNRYLFVFQYLGDRYQGYIAHSEYEEQSISKLSSLLDTFMACLSIYALDKKQKNYILYIIFISCGTVFNNFLGSVFVIFSRIATNFIWIFIFCYSYILQYRLKRFNWSIKSLVILYCLVIYIKALVKNFSDIVPYLNRLFL